MLNDYEIIEKTFMLLNIPYYTIDNDLEKGIGIITENSNLGTILFFSKEGMFMKTYFSEIKEKIND